ncbi:MAG: ribonuclease R [Acetanaerobacterium sp.]
MLNGLSGLKSYISKLELAKRLGISASDKEYHEQLDALIASGEVSEKKDMVILSRKLGLVPATIVKLAGRFGFARENDNVTDYFIPGRAFKGALVGDRVLLKTMPSRGDSPEAEVMQVVSQGASQLSGVFRAEREGNFIYPDSMPKIAVRIVNGGTLGAHDGDKVSVSIVSRGDRHSGHRAKVVAVFGSSETATACALAVLSENNVSIEFPAEVIDEAKTVAQQTITDLDIAGRLDLRDLPIFTIDGADTKDIDDAVSVQKNDHGYTLGVHIADVSHYVTEGSSLDNEAYARGTSVYYANRVVPMLPKELSNGICSLNENVDRLAFSCMMELDETGVMNHYTFQKTVIRSRVKGVYSEINRLLDGTADAPLDEKYASVSECLPAIKELALLRMKQRTARGVPEINTTETKIIISEDGVAVGLEPRERGFAEELIEEFMLCANEAAAMFAQDNKLPFVYRVHEKPTPEKLEGLVETLGLLGVNTARLSTKVHPKDLADILKEVADEPFKRIVHIQVLRSMAKARYSDEPIGHFGLVLDNYSHFTSPIRRYPDLAIHRILSAFAAGLSPAEIEKRYARYAKESSVSASQSEVRAMTSERNCNDCYKAEYMHAHIGEVFDGVISSAAQHGVYVELSNTAEGLIHVDRFPAGNYEYDGRMQFTDTLSGRRLRIGDAVSVVVSGANVASGNVDFDFSPPAGKA